MNAKQLSLILTAALSVPAMAQDAPKSGTAVRPPQIYCVQYEVETGSRIARQECLTRKEWAKRGVNIDELIRK